MLALTPTMLLEPSQSESAETYRYDPLTNTVRVGGDGTATSLTQIRDALGPDAPLVETAPGEWLLTANLQMDAGVTLNLKGTAAGGDANWLKLSSNPTGFVALNIFDARLDAASTKVTSWDTMLNDVDRTIDDGRAYVLVKGRRGPDSTVDVIDSEFAHLGYKKGQSYGFSLRVDNTFLPFLTIHGTIRNSSFHENYHGAYIANGANILWQGNSFYQNARVGLELRNGTEAVRVLENRFFGNASHGLLIYGQSSNSEIVNNEAFDNKLTGLMIEGGSDYNVIAGNRAYRNDAGIGLYDSSFNQLRNNTLEYNAVGVRIGGGEGGQSTENLVEGNWIYGSYHYGLRIYGSAIKNIIPDGANDIRESGIMPLAMEDEINTGTADALVEYDAPLNTIRVTGRGNFVTLSSISASLNNPDLLRQTGEFEWYLGANLETDRQVTLVLHGSEIGGDVDLLRLKSDASGFVHLKAFDGAIRMSDTAVTSWDNAANGPDLNHTDGRAFVLAKARTKSAIATRLDIVNSDVGYLGFQNGEAYGVSWRVSDNAFAKDSRITGSIVNSKLHHNYFGMYSYRATDLQVTGSEFFGNVVYGFDPHDGSNNFLVENNRFYDNGSHGLIFSAYCEGNVIRNNVMYGNVGHGIVLDRESDENLVEFNTVYNNQAGIVIQNSDDNRVENNDIYANVLGIRIDSQTVKTASLNNEFSSNTIRDNANAAGLSYPRNGLNQFEDNIVSGNGADKINDAPTKTVEAISVARQAFFLVFLGISAGTVLIGRHRSGKRALPLPRRLASTYDSIRSLTLRDVLTSPITVIGVILMAALGLRLWGLGEESLWYDELHTVVTIENSYTTLVTEKLGKHPPLFFMMMKPWSEVFGTSEAMLRLPSLMLMMATMTVAAALAKRYLSTLAAIVSVGLMAISPFMVAHAQEGRMYALFSFIFICATFALMRYSENRRRWLWLAVFWLFTAAGLYTHYHYGIFLLVQLGAASLFLLGGVKGTFWTAVRSLPLAALAAIPTLSRFNAMRLDFDQQGRITIQPLQPNLDNLWLNIEPILSPVALGDPDRGTPLIVLGIMMALFAFGALSSIWKKDPKTAFLATCAIMPMVLCVLISFKTPIIRPRYFVALLPFWYLVIGVAITRIGELSLPWRSIAEWRPQAFILRPAMLALLLAFGFTVTAEAHNFHGKERWRESAQYLADHYQTGDSVVVHAAYTEAGFRYYFDSLNPQPYRLTDFYTIYSDTLPSCRLGDTVWFVQAKLVAEAKLMVAEFKKECRLVSETEFGDLTIYGFASRDEP